MSCLPKKRKGGRKRGKAVLAIKVGLQVTLTAGRKERTLKETVVQSLQVEGWKSKDKEKHVFSKSTGLTSKV